ncbi:nucleoside 2-deoxyribosyltransferase domain-containing protein [Streptomyces sp. NPDC001668]|uniref:nucleoside 2-deoxyribosyltransferase domain-containing protein n=1 Tax=Streptomyces sp. NPDC001668 TaxID=3364598 RepID=UPI0036B11965
MRLGAWRRDTRARQRRPGDVQLTARCAYGHGTDRACRTHESVLLVVRADGTPELPPGWTYGTLGESHSLPAAFCPAHGPGATQARYVEAPAEYVEGGLPAVFLAGGIGLCENWQQEAAPAFADLDVVVLNPRRTEFPVHDPEAETAQVTWEYTHLHRAALVLFWFPASESHQPIALYELGRMAAGGTPIVVGADPRYARRNNLVVQLRLARPGLEVHATLADTVNAARAFFEAPEQVNHAAGP